MFEEKRIPTVPLDSPLITYLRKIRRPVVFEEMNHEIESTSRPDPVLTAARDELKKIEGTVCVPLFTEDKMLGLFTLGPKEDAEMFDDEDLNFLHTLSNQLAIAVQKAKLHEEMMEAQARLLHADKLASLGTVAAGMAHEIKNPLASIKGMSEMIEQAFAENDKEALDDFKKVVPKEIDRISSLVQNLLTYSKPPKPQKSPVNLNDILEHLLKLFEADLMKGKIKLIKEFGQIPSKELDPEQMKQVFANLIINSIHAMSASAGELKIKTSVYQGKVKVDILDSGMGIEQDKIKNIFDPFFSTKEKGAGLGLAITYKIIQEHGGEVAVQSEVGKGTLFTLLF